MQGAHIKVNDGCKNNFCSKLKLGAMSTATFVDRIDPFAKRSLKKKQKKSQGSSRYRTATDLELQPLPLLKGKFLHVCLSCVYIDDLELVINGIIEQI